MPHLLANDYTGTKKTLTKGQMRTLLLSVTQTAGDNSQPPTVVLQDIAAEPAKSSPEGPASRMLSWTRTAMVNCSAPKQNHHVTQQKQWMPLQKAQLQHQGKRKRPCNGQRERETATTYFYLQSDGSTWVSMPSSSSTLSSEPYGDPG